MRCGKKVASLSFSGNTATFDLHFGKKYVFMLFAEFGDMMIFSRLGAME